MCSKKSAPAAPAPTPSVALEPQAGATGSDAARRAAAGDPSSTVLAGGSIGPGGSPAAGTAPKLGS